MSNTTAMAQGWAKREPGEIYTNDISVAVASAEHLARAYLALEARCTQKDEALKLNYGDSALNIPA